MKKVLLFGSFDALHPGHLHLFEQAKSYGDYFSVIVARDQTIIEIKGHPPKYSLSERIRALKELAIFNEVLEGVVDDKYAAILAIKPDVICLGYDQKAFVDKLQKYLNEHKLSTKVYRLEAYNPHLYKSSLLNK